jgi:putative toxin-antitoxin system antitoxin component (TIGR02293 family)
MPAEPAQIAELMGGKDVLGVEVRTVGDLERLVLAGLPKEVLQRIAGHVFAEPARRRQLIHAVVPEATYKRRKLRLTPAESERAERLARVIAWARDLWGADNPSLVPFLTLPHPLLDRRSMLEAAQTDLGARRAESVLAALEYGMPV